MYYARGASQTGATLSAVLNAVLTDCRLHYCDW